VRIERIEKFLGAHVAAREEDIRWLLAERLRLLDALDEPAHAPLSERFAYANEHADSLRTTAPVNALAEAYRAGAARSHRRLDVRP